MQTRKIPATIVTGFLGSGKTTLLRHLLAYAQGRRIAVIVNEFGELGIDGELLRGCGIGCDENGEENGQLYELANGCLCCTVQEEFAPVMEKLAARRDQIDHLIIETSGLALPKPLVQAFQWPALRNTFTVDAVNGGENASQLFSLVVHAPTNNPPTCSIATNGTTFTTNDTVTITATASDSDGTVAKVDFYDGATLLGTANSAPFTFSWTNVSSPVPLSQGTKDLKAKATDNNGGVSPVSNSISITVNPAPTGPTPASIRVKP